MRQFRWALIPPIALLLLWEAGKFASRRWARQPAPTVITI